MIKRRFYRTEHGERDDASSASSSSSSSDSDLDAQSSKDSETEPQQEADSNIDAEEADNDDDGDVGFPLRPHPPSSSSSGYESEDSSANEIDAESAGLLVNDDDSGFDRDGDQLNDGLFSRKENGGIVQTLANDNPVTEDVPRCVLKCKSVYKCRLCPKIVCLNEESLRTHLKSKRHARSEKLLNEGRLKRILNSDGEEEVVAEDDGETHAERHARIVAMAQDMSKKKSQGRQRQRQRLKRKKQSSSGILNSGQKTDNRAKRRKEVD